MSPKYEVGKEIEAYCTKCKVDRLHVIETLKSDGNINRVVCRTCEGNHQFRLPKSAKARKASSTRTRRARGAIVVTEEEKGEAKAYSMTGVFEVGDIIDHKKFGLGKVVTVKPGGKIEVGFEDGGKLLVCGEA